MDLTQLHYFQVAATHEHFTRAADVVHVAQSALSRQIRELEAELGLSLFDRVGRGVKLTAAGRTILPRVERILTEVDNIRRDLRALSDLVEGTIALGFLHSIGAHLLPRVLAAFRTQHPTLGFTLHEGSWSELDDMVRKGELDMAIVSPLPEPGSGLEAITLLRDELVAALPAHHRLAGREEITLAALADEPFILLGASFGELRTITMDACRHAGFSPRVTFEAEGLATMRGLVGAGLGVALLPAMASRVRDEGAPAPVCRPLAGRPVHRMIGLVWHHDRVLSPAARAFADLLVARCQQ